MASVVSLASWIACSGTGGVAFLTVLRPRRPRIAATLGLLGLRMVKKATPPMPEQAIQEAKLTTEAIRAR